MADYISVHTGQDVDEAVSYFLSFPAAGTKQVISTAVTGDDWKDNSQGTGGRYTLVVGLSGGYTLEDANPMVYFVDSLGDQWWMDHTYINDGAAVSNGGQVVTCFSNKQITGSIVISSAIPRQVKIGAYKGNTGSFPSITAGNTGVDIGTWYTATTSISPSPAGSSWCNNDTTAAPTGSVLYVVSKPTTGYYTSANFAYRAPR